MLYAAYGSNLHPERFKARAPSARFIATGEMRGWRLTFRGWSGRTFGAVATVEREQGAVVPCVLYDLRSPDDLRSLDMAEGWPRAYRTENVMVFAQSGDREHRFRCFTYIKNAGIEGWPSAEYLTVIRDGLRHHKLGLDHLSLALARLPATPPAREPGHVYRVTGDDVVADDWAFEPASRMCGERGCSNPAIKGGCGCGVSHCVWCCEVVKRWRKESKA